MMRQCVNCNAPMEDDATVCPVCGATYKKPLTQKESATRALAWGIATLILCMSSPLVGLIVWLIAKGKVSGHAKLYGDGDTIARVGSALHKAAFLVAIISIIVTAATMLLFALTYGAFFVLYFVVMVLGTLMLV